MTPEQIERRRKNNVEKSARKYAKVKDTPEFKVKRKLARENLTEEQRAQKIEVRQKWMAKTLAENPEKIYTPKYRIARAKWYKTDKGRRMSCKGKLAARLGVSVKDLPDELVEAKFAQLKVKRLVRDLG
jgi:ABC-type Fe2+-enterobactin transport system substrate-binding protein